MCEGIVKFVVGACFAGVTVLLFANADGSWLTHVPEKERSRPNPYAEDQEAVQAGAKMFRQHCASCHGKDAEGKGKKPTLRSERVEAATPGEIQWLLKNGSLVAGMPSWSRLPEEQSWQLVAYVKSLKLEVIPKK
jgi:mono/diheme cytochrome c family protein